jgi:undecaprenyl diphosphate synthase
MIHHLAIIMDGNRRWAKARFLPAIFGHKAGFDNLKKITRLASDMGIKYLTVWALSTENLIKREEEEIEGIIKLINHSIKLLPEFKENQVKIQVIGDIEKLPKESQDILARLQKETETHTGIVLSVALVY